MKIIFLSIILLIPKLYAKDSYWLLDYSKEKIDYETLKAKAKNNKSDYYFLKYALENIISGNLEMATRYLNQVSDNILSFSLVKKRYFALIHFIKDEFKKSLKYLEYPLFLKNDYYKHICNLRLINHLALFNDQSFLSEAPKCLELNSKNLGGGSLWIRTLVSLKDPNIEFNRETILTLEDVQSSTPILRSWFKLGFYLQLEEEMLPLVKKIPSKSLLSKSFREILAMIYYRTGNDKKALSFIEGIETPNSENIRGNIKLKENKIELAYGFFNLALIKKPNSINSLERVLPLAWLLERWEEGIKMLWYYKIFKKDWRKQMTLNTAFKIRLKEYRQAKDQIRILESSFDTNLPREIGLIKSYLAFIEERYLDAFNASFKECNRLDGINCWYLMESLNWPKLSQTAKRDEVIMETPSIDDLKLVDNDKSLDEDVFILQSDLEELDSKDIIETLRQ